MDLLKSGPKSGPFFDLTVPLNPLTKTPFLVHFVAKSGPFGRFGVVHCMHPSWLMMGLTSIYIYIYANKEMYWHVCTTTAKSHWRPCQNHAYNRHTRLNHKIILHFYHCEMIEDDSKLTRIWQNLLQSFEILKWNLTFRSFVQVKVFYFSYNPIVILFSVHFLCSTCYVCIVLM